MDFYSRSVLILVLIHLQFCIRIFLHGGADLFDLLSCITVASDISRLSGFFTPRLTVRDPCGSASIRRIFLFCFASATPRFTAVVVFPTPPFWFVTAITLQFSIGPFLSYIFESFDPPEPAKLVCCLASSGRACYFSPNPTRLGDHQTAVCFTASWESHPRRVLRWLRREVSLSPASVMAVTGSRPDCPAWALVAATKRCGLSGPAALAPETGKVSDECLFGFQCAEENVLLLPVS